MLATIRSMPTLFPLMICAAVLSIGALHAQEFPEGVEDHGVAAPVGRPTWGDSTHAVVDADGGRTVFVKLWTGGDTSYLFIDAETGETEQIWPDIGGWGAFSTIYIPETNKIYDTLGRWMLEIDVETREIRRLGEFEGQMALVFTSDEDGVIYGGIYPTARIISWNPATEEYTDHGPVNEEEWPQYPRPLAADRHGWVYTGIGQTLSQVIGLNTETGDTVHFMAEEDRTRGQGNVRLGVDGEVYANAPGWSWHRLSAGEATPVEAPPEGVSMRVRQWEDGSRITRIQPEDRRLEITEADAEEARVVEFDYESTGVRIYTLVEGADGIIYGATGVPLRIFDFNPETGEMQDRGLGGHGGHVNQWVRQGDLLYGAVYSSGSLIEWDPSAPYDDEFIRRSENPRHLHGYNGAQDLYGRPHTMLAHPDGRHVLMGGMAARVLTGGAILIYDTETGDEILLDRDDLVADQGPYSMAALPNGDVIVGTTTRASTGGAPTATDAMIYRIDWETKQMTDQWTLEGIAGVRDLIVPEDGLLYGLTNRSFFVFDPEAEEFIHQEVVDEDYGRATGSQAPRAMEIGPDGAIYVLFREAIARIEPGTFEHTEVVRPGPTITAGVAISGDRIYFACGPRLFSYDLSLFED